MIAGVLLTPLRVVDNPKGNIYHGIKASSPGYTGFGEAYFSAVNTGCVKGWKRHNKLTLNIVVPVGGIRFTLFDDRTDSESCGDYLNVCLGPDQNYSRLTVPPGIWLAFMGLGKYNLLMNIISKEHNPTESDILPLEAITYPFTD